MCSAKSISAFRLTQLLTSWSRACGRTYFFLCFTFLNSEFVVFLKNQCGRACLQQHWREGKIQFYRSIASASPQNCNAVSGINRKWLRTTVVLMTVPAIFPKWKQCHLCKLQTSLWHSFGAFPEIVEVVWSQNGTSRGRWLVGRVTFIIIIFILFTGFFIELQVEHTPWIVHCSPHSLLLFWCANFRGKMSL